jgi:NAD(P) transhydrogenase
MAEADSSLFIEMCFNYPTLGQLYKYATYDAMDLRAGVRRLVAKPAPTPG